MTNVFLFGIDGASPDFLFEKWIDDLPTIKRLVQHGCHARMNSTIPPSTIVAWNSMISGRDTSEIGVFSYTIRDKNGHSRLVDSSDVQCNLMWDILKEHDKKSIALYVPLSYPVKPINGCMVSDFLTPRIDSMCAYPESLRKRLQSVPHPDFFFDVVAGLAGHKSLDVDTLIKRTYLMTDMQIDLLKDLLVREEWDFFMAVMIGTDRLQHMLWHHGDEGHRRFVKNSPYKNVLHDYYVYLDKRLGEIIELLDKDTVVIVASDHGMVRQEGKININNWLINEGYLVLNDDVDKTKKQRFDAGFVDMNKSLAYGGGAYNGRVYINRKKAGKNYTKIVAELTQKLKLIPDDKGKPLQTFVYYKEDTYTHPNLEECPDLTVYFDDLRWASNPDLGQEGLYSWETAVGADSAGHSRQGSFLIAGPGVAARGRIADVNIAQVAPTILGVLGVPIPSDIKVNEIKIKSKLR